MLAQCDALLKRHIPNFDLENLDEIIARESVDVNPTAAAPNPAFQFQPQHRQPSYPPAIYPPHILYPPFGPVPFNTPYFVQDPPPKGQDPRFNDMSNTQALAKNFGVAAAIVNDLGPNTIDKEDLAVGSNGLSSGRDRILESSTPRDTANWRTVSFRRRDAAITRPPHLALTSPVSDPSSAIDVWLPKDRNMVNHIVNVYFTRLNLHRPVFTRQHFEKALDDLYADRMPNHDPGFICSVYLVFALGTLSELNHRAQDAPHLTKKLLPEEWPEHDEFFERALLVKPDLLVTISSLQALILLHWYLYIEVTSLLLFSLLLIPLQRQGRTLWRLVGSLVRLSIELGLHHDPTTQTHAPNGPDEQPQPIFTEEECQLRIRLWGIVLVHDRGTSILLGRPLGISPSDTNTPRPSRPKNAGLSDFSEHFELSHPIAEIQADIINSLYSPARQSGDTIMRNATRIIKSMLEFRTGLPEKYKNYFGGTDDWPLERKSKLVQEITEDEGLTLLKLGIARILLLRALFSLKDLGYTQRRKALIDAIVTSHNTIIVHSVLIRFPDIGFFTSPIPLHIAAMVILYGHMSKCDCLPHRTAVEDIWLALDMLPRFRWRWERKDVNGGHPLISKLAERVMEVNLHAITPTQHAILLPEPEWEEDTHTLPNSHQTTPTLTAAPYGPPNAPIVYGPQPRLMNGSVALNGLNGHADKNMAEIPSTLFYPFYPETPAPAHDYNALLAAAAAQPPPETYMSEERGAMMWVNVVS